MLEKIREIFEHFFVKLYLSIPLCFFVMEDREREMLWGFGIVIIIDTFLGVLSACFKGEFDFGVLGKKTAKKFTLYFLALALAFVTARLYDFLGFLFYWLGSILLLSEVGSSYKKISLMGVRIPVQDLINSSIDKIKK